MQHIKHISLIFILYTSCACAQVLNATHDTLMYKLGEPIVITATRFAIAPVNAPSSVQLFQKNEIEMMNGNSLADILRFSTGSTLTPYGGAGSLQLLSMRGLGPEYSMVMINGVRINDVQNGTVDIGRIPLSNIDNIEVAPGGYSSMYGSNALGGVINIVTKQSPSLISASVGTGSFGWNRYDLQLGVTDNIGTVHVLFESERAKNNFLFIPQHDVHAQSITRMNSDFNRQNILLDGKINLSSSEVQYYSNYSSSDVGVPGAYIGNAQGHARQYDKEIQSILTWKKPISGSSFIRSVFSFNYSDERYNDPSIIMNNNSLQSEYQNQTPSISIQYDNALTDNIHFMSGSDFSISTLKSEEVAGAPQRNVFSAYVSSEYNLIMNEESNMTSFILRFYPSLRFDYVNDKAERKDLMVLLPSLGLNYSLVPNNIYLRTKVAQNYRVPTFNQLYWKQGGNPDLKPEYSISFESGFIARTSDAQQSIDVDYFYHTLKDKIVWMPGTGIFWVPKNIQHVVSQGIEATIKLNVFTPHVQITLNGQWNDAQKINSSFAGDQTQGKQLVYVPFLKGNIMLTLNWNDIQFFLSEQFLGKRYTDEVNTEENALPFHTITNASIQFHYAISPSILSLKFEVENVFNQQYEMIAYYPMPSRSIRAKLSVLFP